MSNKIVENSFYPAPGGSLGSLNYQSSIGNHASPNNYQNPSKFASSDANKYFDSNSTGQPDTRTSMDQSGSFDGEVEKLFKNKEKPTMDDVLAGIHYELNNMIAKDKHIAKLKVIDNLKKHGPKYYTKLHMLNIDDKDMDSPMAERINVLNQMIEEKKEKRKDMQLNDSIKDILQQKRDEKIEKSNYLISSRKK